MILHQHFFIHGSHISAHDGGDELGDEDYAPFTTTWCMHATIDTLLFNDRFTVVDNVKTKDIRETRSKYSLWHLTVLISHSKKLGNDVSKWTWMRVIR